MLMRFDPFRDLDRVTSQARAFSGWGRAAEMPLDALRHEDKVLVRIDLPGVDPTKVELTVDKNVLTVRAERSWEPAEGDEVIVSERPQGSFSRQLFLGESLDAAQVSATYEAGVLTVTIPVAERAKAKRIEITASDGAIDARSL